MRYSEEVSWSAGAGAVPAAWPPWYPSKRGGLVPCGRGLVTGIPGLSLTIPVCLAACDTGGQGTMAQALGEELALPSELQDDSSSLGSDSELSGPSPYRQADRYGFIGGNSAEPG